MMDLIAFVCNGTTKFSRAVRRHMTTFVLPIGFDTRRVTRPIVHHGFDATDTVVLVRPVDDGEDENRADRSSRAIADVREFLHEIEPETGITVERISREDFTQTILDCSNLLAAATEPVVGLCGGPRDVLLPLTVAAVLHADHLQDAYVFSDIDGTIQKWTLPDLTASIPGSARNTLALLQDSEQCSLSELADRVERSKSTVGRHLDALEDAGLVRTWTEGKHRQATVTDSACILAHAMQDASDFMDP